MVLTLPVLVAEVAALEVPAVEEVQLNHLIRN